jgi:MFS family permease
LGTARGKRGTFAPLGVRDFALLWSGQSASSIGDGIFTVALALEALRIDRHPEGLAFVLAARAVPSVVFALAGGVLVDRMPRRLAMLGSDLARGLAVTAIALLVAAGELQLWELVVMSVAFGTADAFFGPASMAVMPELLPPELLVQGNALNSTSHQLAQNLLGPAVGGLVVGAIGSAWSFGCDAASFAVSTACLIAMRAREPPPPSGHSLLGDALAGIGYIKSRRWLLGLLVAGGLANLFAAPTVVLVPLLVRHALHGSALGLGLVFASGGAAGVLASLVVGRLGAPSRRVIVIWTVYGLSALCTIAMAFSPAVWVVGVLTAAETGLIVYGDVLYVAMMQDLVPGNLLGRVSSVAYLIAFVLAPIGILSGGVVAALIGARGAVLASGLLSGACCLVVFVPGIREPDRNPQPAAM